MLLVVDVEVADGLDGPVRLTDVTLVSPPWAKAELPQLPARQSACNSKGLAEFERPMRKTPRFCSRSPSTCSIRATIRSRRARTSSLNSPARRSTFPRTSSARSRARSLRSSLPQPASEDGKKDQQEMTE
ncbi:MAG: hypothetical protein M3417_10425, partial [Actinomycetota bacterium]|nr:hypothetical protein [Actinomycetota bacterium]